MLADAIAAESYKLLRNRSLLFWGFCAGPLGYFLFNLSTESYLFLRRSGVALLSSGPQMDMGQQMMQGLSASTSFFFEIFIVAGAAALFAGEYRWESWRLLVPRNSRTNLILAKFIVFSTASALGILAFGVFGALGALYTALLNGMTPGVSFAFPNIAGVFAGSLAELVLLGGVAALVVTVTRAQMAAMLAGIFFIIAQTIGMGIAHPWEAPLRYFAYMPAMSAYIIRAWAAGQPIGPGVFAHPATVLFATLFLALWIVVLAGVTTGLFQRQDLSRE